MTVSSRTSGFPTGFSLRQVFADAVQSLFPGWGVWLVLAIVTSVNLVWIGSSPRITSDAAWLFTSWPIALCCAAYAGTRQRQGLLQPHLGLLLKLVMLVSFSGSSLAVFRVFNHLVNTLSLSLVDAQLLALDRAIGFDWSSYTNWIATHGNVSGLMAAAYDGIYIVLFAIALWHVMAGRDNRASEISVLLFGTAILCSALGALFPAYGAMQMLGTPELMASLRPGAGTYAVEAFNGVRSEGIVSLVSTALPGLTTCPSYHTTLGLLAVYFCRGNNLALAATGAYAAVMIASTPVFGGHYLFDVIAGIAFTAFCIGLWRAVQGQPAPIASRQALARA